MQCNWGGDQTSCLTRYPSTLRRWNQPTLNRLIRLGVHLVAGRIRVGYSSIRTRHSESGAWVCSVKRMYLWEKAQVRRRITCIGHIKKVTEIEFTANTVSRACNRCNWRESKAQARITQGAWQKKRSQPFSLFFMWNQLLSILPFKGCFLRLTAVFLYLPKSYLYFQANLRNICGGKWKHPELGWSRFGLTSWLGLVFWSDHMTQSHSWSEQYTPQTQISTCIGRRMPACHN